MNLPGIPELVGILFKAWPGAFGSALSVFWGQRAQPVLRRVVLFVSGSIFSLFAAPEVAKLPGFHLQEGFLLGFMLGLCSMALCGKIYTTLESFNLSRLARDASRKMLGLPPIQHTVPAGLTRD